MINVAFFFDDNNIVKTFSELDLSKVGLVNVGFFDKSKEDIEKLVGLKPQLIICDESFARITEKEFVSEIKDVFNKAVIIKFGRLSSFNNVRNAFKIGYNDYVTLDDYMGDPYEMFLDIVNNNDYNAEESYESQNLIENELKKYAFGSISSFTQRHNINPESVIFASIAMVNFDYTVRRDWAYEKERMLFAFKNIINELMQNFENGEFFFQYYSQLYLVFTPTDIVDKYYVKKAVRTICDTLANSLGILSFGIVKDEVCKLNDYLKIVGGDLERLCVLHTVAHDYVYFETELLSEFVEDFDSTRMSKRFETLLDNLDFEGAVNEIRSLSVIRPARTSMSDFEDYIKFVFNGVRQLDIQNQVGLVKEDDIDKIIATYNLPVIIEYFTCCIYAISDFISEDKYVSLQIQKYLQDHLADNITLQDISDNFNFEYTYTSKYFTQIMGMPFKKYFNNLRLSTALNMLKSTDLKCYEIAAKCGYNNYEHFSRIFYKKFGIWPKEIVRQNKQ